MDPQNIIYRASSKTGCLMRAGGGGTPNADSRESTQSLDFDICVFCMKTCCEASVICLDLREARRIPQEDVVDHGR